MAEEVLSPIEIHKMLAANRLCSRIHYFEKLASTNNTAQKLARQGVPEGEIVVADEQTHGKGRMGRTWSSPVGTNLYVSLILRPKLLPSHAPQISLMAAVAVADTVAFYLSFAPEIKWPNDILVQGKKIAGILTESSCDVERVLYVILGIGVNLNYSKADMPETIRENATSLLELTQRPVDRNVFAARLIHNLDQCYGTLEEFGFYEIKRRWEDYFSLRGKRVIVEMPEGKSTGKALGVDMNGALILEGKGGGKEVILAGDVIPINI